MPSPYRDGGIVAVNVLGGPAAIARIWQGLKPHFRDVYALHMSDHSLVFASTPIDAASEALSLPDVVAAARACSALHEMYREVVEGHLSRWGLHASVGDMIKQDFGFGWYANDELGSIK